MRRFDEAAAPLASLLCLIVGLALWFDQRPEVLASITAHVPERIASASTVAGAASAFQAPS